MNAAERFGLRIVVYGGTAVLAVLVAQLRGYELPGAPVGAVSILLAAFVTSLEDEP